MLSNAEAIALAGQLEKDAGVEWARLRRFVRYSRGLQKMPWLPDNTESEYRDIAKKSASNWIDLVIRAVAQGLRVDGYGDESEDSPVWESAWQANGMDARQAALHRAVLTCGYGYLLVFPAEGGGVVMRPEAATKMFAVYDDPGDEWPLVVVRKISDKKLELYDADARYTIDGTGAGRRVSVVEHGQGVPPVVQMRSSLDLLGLPQGEVEPVIPIQDRIVDATFTLQMVGKYGAFPQRWIAGMKVLAGLDDDGNPLTPQVKAYVDHILMAEDADTKFGQFAAADLNQYVAALEAHIRHLAAITQTPPHYLLGSLVNLSAEALAAAESGLQRKINDKRSVLGEGYEQALRLAAGILGDEEAAMDTSSQVHWQDVESRSLAQVADALVKLQTLGVPLSVLLPMIPTLTKTDVDQALAEIEEGGGVDALARRLAEAATPAAA